MVRPICFMVMPFGSKPVFPKVENAPEEIDFDALWNKVLSPTIESFGYDPVRADQDTGSAIIMEMLERLFFSDLVVADMTIPNGNVYYEIGIRHASRERGCVLISADWARPLFDTNQMRRLTYPLPEGVIGDETAEKIRAVLTEGARKLAEGLSPMYQHIPGFPDPREVDSNRAAVIRKQLDALSAFQIRVREARLASSRERQRELALALLAEYPARMPLSQVVALEMVGLVRDCVGWHETIEYIDALPQSIRDQDYVQEQRSLAESKSGNHERAIGALQEIIRRHGDSSERQGLIGGRFKKMMAEAQRAGNERLARDYLDNAIEHYENGMKLDLNDFFPTANLPFLYRERDDEGDGERAHLAAKIAEFACERDSKNPWSKPTLLTLAFFEADVERAKHLARAVRREGAAAWQLESTLDTLDRSVKQAADGERKRELASVLDDLRAMLTA